MMQSLGLIKWELQLFIRIPRKIKWNEGPSMAADTVVKMNGSAVVTAPLTALRENISKGGCLTKLRLNIPALWQHKYKINTSTCLRKPQHGAHSSLVNSTVYEGSGFESWSDYWLLCVCMFWAWRVWGLVHTAVKWDSILFGCVNSTIRIKFDLF